MGSEYRSNCSRDWRREGDQSKLERGPELNPFLPEPNEPACPVRHHDWRTGPASRDFGIGVNAMKPLRRSIPGVLSQLPPGRRRYL